MDNQEKTSSATMFNEAAATWDQMPSTSGMCELEKNWIVQQTWWKPPLDGPAMDFGCGTGALTMAVRGDLGQKVVGVDPSPDMLAEFEKKAADKGVTTFAVELTGPGQLGEGADGSFAFIYTSLALHHIRDCQKAITALTDYLRPGGRLLLFDFEATKDAELFHPADFELGNHLERHGIAEEDLRSWCDKTGQLEDIQVDRIPFRKERGAMGAFGTGPEFQLLALSCTKTLE